jgi:hypothetical protein
MPQSLTALSPQQAAPARCSNCLEPVVSIQTAEEAPDVVTNGLGRDAEPRGHLLRARSLSEHPEDLDLSRGQGTLVARAEHQAIVDRNG